MSTATTLTHKVSLSECMMTGSSKTWRSEVRPSANVFLTTSETGQTTRNSR